MKHSRKSVARKTHAIPNIKFEQQQLTSFAGLVILQPFLAAIDLTASLARCFRHTRAGKIYGRATVFLQLIIHLLLGYRDLRESAYYRDDPMVKRVLGLKRLPDVATVSRMLKDADEKTVKRLRHLLRHLVVDRLRTLSLSRVTLDFDGSVQSTGRHAEATEHYKAFLAIEPDLDLEQGRSREHDLAMLRVQRKLGGVTDRRPSQGVGNNPIPERIKMNNNPEEQDKGNKLEELYESTSEDLAYGIGIVWLPDEGPTPIIQIHYRDWSRQKLEVVRGSFRGGIVLDGDRRMGGAHAVYISTREKITLQTERNGHTSILRAPAWDTHLANVDKDVYSHFECERSRHGGFQLMIQIRMWEFLTTVDEAYDRTIVGDVFPHFLPSPQDNTMI